MGKIYHYTTLKTAIEFILPSMKLRTNFLNKMNGPNENQRWSFGSVNVPYEDLYPLPYANTDPSRAHFDRMYLFGEEIKSKIQAICFVHSDHYDGYENEMMWAQYAENHKGVCLEIDIDLFLEENSAVNFFQFKNIEYETKEKDWFRWDRNLSKEENINRFIQKNYKALFLSKSHYWEKEFEKRLLILKENHCFLNIKKSLSGIYFGLFFNYNYTPSILQYTNSDELKIYRIYFEENKLKRMEIKPS